MLNKSFASTMRRRSIKRDFVVGLEIDSQITQKVASMPRNLRWFLAQPEMDLTVKRADHTQMLIKCRMHLFA